MKDLHTHLLYGIDDGCKSIEESIDLNPNYQKKIKYVVTSLSNVGLTAALLTIKLDK